jgi:predicted ATPase
MLIGVFLRNIKSYDKTFFIPTVKNNKPYAFYIGENGVGKSSILEALNVYFNNLKEWNINKKCKKMDEVFIAPVFLINHKNAEQLPLNELEYLKGINNSLVNWNIDDTPYLKPHEWISDFYNFLKELKILNDLEEHYLFIAPNHYDKNVTSIYFAFENLIQKEIPEYNRSTAISLINSIKNQYSYIYIPVETPVDEVLKMETPEMQMLISEDILEYTENLLIEKNILEGNRKINIVDKINGKLEEFMVDVNYTISLIDPSYAYSVEGQGKKYLTASDIREQIFKAYFSIRRLSKNQKDIVKLSSGEKRKALIDIATAFLKQDTKGRKNMILAIDEPETSMHMKRIFNQFKQLESLSTEHNIQFIGTTHWYGFLPITDYGNLNHISILDDKVSIHNLDFFNLYETNTFPDDIEMKSFFELVTSILTSIKTTDFNKWIICEGSDDKKYLEYYLKGSKNKGNLTILPVSGCGNVKKLYHLLYASLSEKDRVKVDGKILCLVDTDVGSFGLNNNILSDKEKIIYIRRLQIVKNKIILEKINPNSSNHFQTEVEDCLEPQKYYNTLKEVVKNTNVEEIFNSYELNLKSTVTKVRQFSGESLLSFNENIGLGKHVNQFKQLVEYLEQSDIKQKICKIYIKHEIDNDKRPSWIKDILNLLELEDDSTARVNEENIENNTVPDENYTSIISNKLNQNIINLIEENRTFLYIQHKEISQYIIDNKKNTVFITYINEHLIDIINEQLLKILISAKIEIKLSISDLLQYKDILVKKDLYRKLLHLLLINNNITDDDLDLIKSKINSKELIHNDASYNDFLFSLYTALKLNNAEYFEKIIDNPNILKIINSVFTVKYYQHFKTYIKIGYEFQNIVSLSNNLLYTKSLYPYIDLYIHALKQYDVFSELLKLDKNKSFIKKLTTYYKNKPIQDNDFNSIFNKIFNDFNI